MQYVTSVFGGDNGQMRSIDEGTAKGFSFLVNEYSLVNRRAKNSVLVFPFPVIYK